MAKAKTIQVAVLVDTSIDGIEYKVGNVVRLDAKIAKQAKEVGNVDDHPEAVAYRRSMGEEVQVHVAAIEADAVGAEAEEVGAETKDEAATEGAAQAADGSAA